MGTHPASGGRVVLVVDDHPSIREALGLVLEETYDVLFADDGELALQLLATKRVDAVLLDLGLPGMDGFEVLARISQVSPDLPVIIVTVKDTAADAVRALKLGAHDYVTKPVDDDALLTKLADALTGPTSSSSQESTRGPRSNGVAEPRTASPDHYLRPGCLVVARHTGTAGTLRLILDRYVPTNAASDGVRAIHGLGMGVPNCVVVDEPAWAAGGTTFVRVLRMRAPGAQVLLFAQGPVGPMSSGVPGNGDITQHARLDEVVRSVLRTFGLAETMLPSPSLSDRVFAALDYMRLHYAEALSAEGIAEAAGTSRSCLAQRFQAELGTSISHFVTTLRVEIARLLLCDGTAKLDEVSTLAGFSDSSHLSRAFRAQTGYRPGAYRRQFVS